MEDKSYERAKKRMENLKSFYIHLAVFILFNSMLFLINFLSYEESGHWWFLYPLLGWGIGLASHGISVASFGIFGPDWEEKKIQEYIEKEKRTKV
ncbi:histidine kinase [Oceanobacillus piezotolerans]|uniref:Histidine kinase n=1 Tax=Oceanobacillus piezotolerans TaxID=2448030 RepID=A0A498DES1_9BACI|nr:2TM domain-containing protein [Oceanobacillus piezotolerans]RLL45494.1 histidine kinase [Oceanobacillus piezotolerans]